MSSIQRAKQVRQIRERIVEPHHLLRAMFPPWQNLQHPLVQFEVRRQERAPNFGWTLLIVLFFGLLSLDIALVNVLLSDSQMKEPFTNQVLPALGSAVLGTVALWIALLHWRLVIMLAARTARSIAARRQRGDWELIAVSPLSRMRWMQMQMTGLGWQIFPMVRQMLIANFLFLLMGGGYLLYFYSTEYGNTSYYETPDIPLVIYAIAAATIGFVAALFPLIEVPLYTAVGLFASSRSQRITMSMLYSFLGIFITRIVLTTILFYSAVIIFLIVGSLMSTFGLLADFDLSDFNDIEAEVLLLGILYSCIAIPITALFLEWLPGLPIVLMAADFETDAFVWFWISTVLVGTLVYIYMPLRLLRWLTAQTVRRLNRRE